MNEQEAKKLLEKYENGLASPEEKELVESWYLDLSSKAGDMEAEPDYFFWSQRIKEGLPLTRYRGPQKLWRTVAAAAVLLLVAGAVLYYNRGNYLNTENPTEDSNSFAEEIKPGGNRAYLTLANGKKLSLTDAGNGKLAKEADVEITKATDGEIVYTVKGNSEETASVMNTIETPKGGQYQIHLPDGTKVWLNSATTLRYPAKFTGPERRVELKGEGYFEVARNPEKPFRVVSNHQVVEVLGTHFNVNSYPDEEDIKTTLLEGSVKVDVEKAGFAIIKPGEQSTVKGSHIKVAQVNTDDVISWVNNIFSFNNEDLGSIMRELSRWYDIEVICPPEMSRHLFTGSISKQKNIQEVLEIMNLTQTFHFKIEGRRITVMP